MQRQPGETQTAFTIRAIKYEAFCEGAAAHEAKGDNAFDLDNPYSDDVTAERLKRGTKA